MNTQTIAVGLFIGGTIVAIAILFGKVNKSAPVVAQTTSAPVIDSTEKSESSNFDNNVLFWRQYGLY